MKKGSFLFLFVLAICFIGGIYFWNQEKMKVKAQKDFSENSTVFSTASSVGENDRQENIVNHYPYALAKERLDYPAMFKFSGMNVPRWVTLDFSEGLEGSVIFKRNDSDVQEYHAIFNEVATKNIRIYGTDGIRTIQVNTEIVIQPIENDSSSFVEEGYNSIYLFTNREGGISLATPNYAGNMNEGDDDVMLEVTM